MLGQRLKKIRGKTRQDIFAQKFDIHRSTYARYERNESVPDAVFLKDLCERYGISPRWLLMGVEPMMEEDMYITDHEGKPFNHQAAAAPFGLVLIKKAKARISAGTGSLETDDDEKALYAFRENWIITKGSTEHMALMEITGDSMEPDLQDGDTILVDRSKTTPTPGIIYIIGIDDDVLCKQFDRTPGKWLFRSKNKDYQPIEVDINDESQRNAVRILGQVIWSCREW